MSSDYARASILNFTSEELIGKFGKNKSDTGRTEVQVVLLQHRIYQISQHLSEHRKDYATKRGLQKLIGQRNILLRYLRRESVERHTSLVQALGI